jgi:hypothetical protein
MERRMRHRFTALLPLATLAAAVAALAPAPAQGAMQSTELSRNLCQTTGGGRFVEIPGFPGEWIDQRLIRDIRWMRRKFNIFITDGYSTSPAHSANGEHPRGLATDIVPYFSRGGTWQQIDDLAEHTEPAQNQPRPPWRWVGWDGDAGHGWGDHLHLSWSHSDTPFGQPARVVYTRRCPREGLAKYAQASPGFSSRALETEIAPAVPEPDE